MTESDCHTGRMNENERRELGARVLAARQAAGMDKEPAARDAKVSSITWTRVEAGDPVRDTSLAKVLRVIGQLGQPQAVAQSPMASIPDAELLAEIARRFARASERTGADHGNPAANTQTGGSPVEFTHEVLAKGRGADAQTPRSPRPRTRSSGQG